jgi:4-amino-4-deoxy-L-arabinose transferase-like glycosyltransferase
MHSASVRTVPRAFSEKRDRRSEHLLVKSDTYRDIAIITVVSMVVLAMGLGNSRFWDQDEGYYASVALEMHERHDWVVPTFNEELFAHKPPMMYWGMLVGFNAFGPSEFSARLASALFGIASAMLTYWLGRRLFDAATGLVAALALASCFMFSVVARSATADAHLTFFVLLSIALWARDAFSDDGSVAASESPSDTTIPVRWGTWCAVYAAMGLAVLSKGPIGLAFPVTILGIVHCFAPVMERSDFATAPAWQRAIWFLARLHPVVFARTVWSMRPLTAMAMVLVVAGPWFWAMQQQTGGAFLSEFLGVHHLNRFSQPMDNHSGPIFYYVLACLIGLYPWSSFALPTVMAWCHRDAWSQRSRSMLLVSAWIGVYVIVFSVASTKLPNYVMPAYPAMALVIGYYVSTWRAYQLPRERAWQMVGWGCMLGLGIATLVGPWALTWSTASGSWMDRWAVDDAMQKTVRWVALLGIPLVLGGWMGMGMRSRNWSRFLPICFAATSVVMLVLFWQWVVPMADRHQTPQDVAYRLRHVRAPGVEEPIAVLSLFRPSMVYYSGGPIRFCSTPEEMVRQTVMGRKPILVLSDDSFEVLHSQLPPEYRIVERYPSFPKRGNMLIVSPEPLLR